MINLIGLRDIGVIGAVIAIGYMAYSYVDNAATTRCENDNLFVVSQAVEEQRQYLLAEQDRSNEISDKLLVTQRRLNETQKQYLTYANAITGNCNGDDFRMFVQYASGSTNEPRELSPTSSTPPTGAITKDPSDIAYEEAVARLIAENLATNYTRLDLCIAEKRAINEFHKPKESIK